MRVGILRWAQKPCKALLLVGLEQVDAERRGEHQRGEQRGDADARDDPKLALLRLDTEKAEIWLGGSSFGAAITRLFGKDPKASYKDNIAEVAL